MAGSDLPSVSIALATYNGERFLAEQLESLLNQTRPPSEIVVTDDKSSDRTVDILRLYQKVSKTRIRISVNQERLGYKDNFRKAASLCTSDLILFCDQDDVWDHRKVETIIPVFDDPEVLLVYHNALVVSADRAPLVSLIGREPHTTFFGTDVAPWHFAPGFTQAFRSSLRRFDDLWSLGRDHTGATVTAHDRWYMFLALSFGRVTFINNQLAEYRQHATNTHGAGKKRSWVFRVTRPVGHRLTVTRKEASAAEARANLLRIARSSHSSYLAKSELDRASVMAKRYDDLSMRLHRKQRLIAGRSFVERLSAWREAVRSGDYKRSRSWPFAPRAMPLDLLLGVILKR